MLEKYLQLSTTELKNLSLTDSLAFEALSVKLYEKRNENLQEFLNFFPSVQNSNCQNALFYYGLHFYSATPSDLQLACQLFKKSADLGHAFSQYFYGLALFYGEGVEQNHKKAIEYLTASANNDHPQAITTLAEIYFLGDGIEQNIDNAIYWYEKAKEQQSSLVLYNLAKCYEIKGDAKLATENYQKCYDIAFNVVNEECFTNLFLKNSLLFEDEDFIFNSPDPFTALKIRASLFNALNELILRDNQEYFNELLSSNNLNYSNLNYVLARAYEIGYKLEQNYSKAIEYYTLASEQGHPMACDRLGEIFKDGIYVEKDLLKAQNYYRLASIGGFERQKYSDNSGGFSYIPISSEKSLKRGLTTSRIKYALLFEQTIPDLLRVAKSSELITNNEKAGLLISEEFYLKLVKAEFIVAYNNSNGGKYETEQLLLFNLRHPELDSEQTYLKLLDYVKTYSYSVELLKYFNALTLANDENLIFVNICNCNDMQSVVDAMNFYQNKDKEKAKILKEKSANLGYQESIYDLATLAISLNDLSTLDKLEDLSNNNFEKATDYLVNYYIQNYNKNQSEYLEKLEKYADNKNVKALEFLLNKKVNEKKYLLICLQMQEFSNSYPILTKRLGKAYHDEYDFENALKFTDNIVYKNLYRMLLGKVDTFTNHDLLIDFYFRFKRILFSRLKEFNSEIAEYKNDLENERLICESRKELCSYLNEYSKQISNERNIELISLLTCSLLDEESLVRRALYILEKDYNEAITLLRLAGDYPYAKYNLVLIENLYKKSKVGFIAKNKVKRAMIKLQKSFLPAYNWLNENYPNKAIKPNDTTKVVEDILFKG